MSRLRSQLPLLVLSALVVSLPVLETLFLLRGIGGSLQTFVPTYSGVYNDALGYWRTVLTFSQVGFQGGYYTFNELPAPASFTHFYVYGPMYPLIYGTLGRVFGWYPVTGVIINLGLVSAAIVGFITLTRPDKRQLIL